jgi:hypothetical protein
MDYQTHPDPSCYGIETRDGQSLDDYIAKARRFNSTAEWREFRDANPVRREAMQHRNRDNATSTDSDDDRRRTLELLKASQ